MITVVTNEQLRTISGISFQETRDMLPEEIIDAIKLKEIKKFDLPEKSMNDLTEITVIFFEFEEKFLVLEIEDCSLELEEYGRYTFITSALIMNQKEMLEEQKGIENIIL